MKGGARPSNDAIMAHHWISSTRTFLRIAIRRADSSRTGEDSNKASRGVQMEFTGERFVPELHGDIELEHIHRYLQASEIAEGKMVLDIACGEGYGSAILANKATYVTGVDISSAAIQHAGRTYQKANLEFKVGSCADIPLPDASVDLVVSFETIEHHDQHHEMMREIKRVLRPSGVLLISSPEKRSYSDQGQSRNPYHVKELYQHEFEQLLQLYFRNTVYFGQRILYGSSIFSFSCQTAVVCHQKQGDGMVSTPGVRDPLYLIALASDNALPRVSSSVLEQPLSDSETVMAWSRLVAERDQSVQTLSATVEQKEQALLNLRLRVGEQDKEIRSLEVRLAGQEARAEVLSERVSEFNTQVQLLSQQIKERDNQAAEQEARIQVLTSQAESRKRELAEIKTSRAWMIAQAIRRIHQAIAPPESLHARLIHKRADRFLNSRTKKESALIRTSPLFDEEWYVSQYPDVARAGVDPALHYLKYGWVEGRDPSSGFSSSWYLTVYKDVETAGINPLVHYIKYGRAEGRLISSQASPPARVAAGKTIEDLEAFAKTIRLSTSAHPDVSIIIPVHGHCVWTLGCLSAIAENPPSTPFEIIVVDDCSPDNTAEILGHVAGIRLIRNPGNLGFIRSCNLGAESARGRFLHFLNNDTEVTAGWLDELVRTFVEFPNTGLAGSKLIYPDGRLQEAGGILWRDCNAWNFGRNQHASLPQYNYAREVDYCSGASIMVPRSLFRELGGFDEYYLPAYCEDADLALKIRKRGLRVIYQPLSVVVHHEGVSSGTDLTKGVKAHQAENMKKLFERWREYLEHHQASGEDVDKAKDRAAKFRVLVVDHVTPTPDQDSGSVDIYNMFLLLREMGFQITFIPEDNYLYVPQYTADLQRIGVEVLFAPYCTSVEQHLQVHGGRYDLVFLFRVGVVHKHLADVRKYCVRAKVLYHTVDLHHLRMIREARLLNDPAKEKEADRIKNIEIEGIRSVDMTTVVSSAELDLLRSELPDAKIRVLPYSRHVRGTDRPFAERQGIVFVGSYQHPPNVDAVRYFIDAIMPLIRRRLPGVRLNVVGSNMPPEIQSLAARDISMVGFVQKLPSFLDGMRVNVAPLRYGAGIKGKIGYAMSVGLPTVATSPAVEGMSLSDEETVLVADTSEEFAEAVVRLYQDESLWNKMSRKGLEFSESNWGAEAAWSTLSSILKDVGFPIAERKNPLVLYQSQSERSPHMSAVTGLEQFTGVGAKAHDKNIGQA